MAEKVREILFSVTAKDCDWQYFKAPGPGGQKKNKTSSAVRCIHRASGAVGQATESRSQHENRRVAFTRMAQTEAFKRWHKIEVARRTGAAAAIEDEVNYLMQDRFIRTEVKEDGRWVELQG